MTIVFSNYDSPDNPWYRGGGARAIQEVARRLRIRHSVRVVCGAFPGATDAVLDGVDHVRLGWRRAGPRLGQLLFQLALPRAVRRADFDVWVESLTPPFSTACLPRFTRRPVVALTQVLAGRGMAAKYHLPFDRLERRGLRTYRHAIATSEYLRRQLLEIHPDLDVTVIPNGVERALIHAQPARDEQHVLFLGRLDIAQKGIDLLLRAVAETPGWTVPVVLAGAGVPGDEARIRNRLRELGLESRVRLTGRVDGEPRLTLLRQAFCLALPSRFEASPLVIPEAFCFALPVVMFDIPHLAGYPDSACLRVPAFDTRLYGQAVQQLLHDTPRRRTMGHAAKQEAARYDWDRLAADYESSLARI